MATRSSRRLWLLNSLTLPFQTRNLFQIKFSKRRTSVGVHKPKHIGRKRSGQGRNAKSRSITKSANRGDYEGVQKTGITAETSSNSLVGTTKFQELTNGRVLKRSRTTEFDKQVMLTNRDWTSQHVTGVRLSVMLFLKFRSNNWNVLIESSSNADKNSSIFAVYCHLSFTISTHTHSYTFGLRIFPTVSR